MTIPVINQIETPFAFDPDPDTVNTIPQVNTDSGNPQNASFEKGFPSITMPTTATSGRPPNGQDMNGILQKLSQIILWYCVGAGFSYNGTLYNNSNPYITGYPVGARVKRADNQGYWLNMVNNNQTDPDNPAATGWQPDVVPGQYNVIIPTNGTTSVTLNLQQAAYEMIFVDEGGGVVLSAPVTITVPDTLVKNYVIKNELSVNIIFKTSNVASPSITIVPGLYTVISVYSATFLVDLSMYYTLKPPYAQPQYLLRVDGDTPFTITAGDHFTVPFATPVTMPAGWYNATTYTLKPTVACTIFLHTAIKVFSSVGLTQAEIILNKNGTDGNNGLATLDPPSLENNVAQALGWVQFNGTTDSLVFRVTAGPAEAEFLSGYFEGFVIVN